MGITERTFRGGSTARHPLRGPPTNPSDSHGSPFEDAVAGVVAAKLRNSGQVCISPNRVYVQDKIYDRFAAAVVDKVAKIKVDEGMREEFVVGPLINKAGFDKVVALVEDSKQNGARVALGGKPHSKGGLHAGSRSGFPPIAWHRVGHGGPEFRVSGHSVHSVRRRQAIRLRS